MWKKDLIQELRAVLEKLPDDLAAAMAKGMSHYAGEPSLSRRARPRREPKLAGEAEAPSWQEIGQDFLRASYLGTLHQKGRAEKIAEAVSAIRQQQRSAIEGVMANGGMTVALKNGAHVLSPALRTTSSGPTMAGGMPLSLSQMHAGFQPFASTGQTMGGSLPVSLSGMASYMQQQRMSAAMGGVNPTMAGGMPLSLSHMSRAQALARGPGKLSGMTAAAGWAGVQNALAGQPLPGPPGSAATGGIGLGSLVKGLVGYQVLREAKDAVKRVMEFPGKQFESLRPLSEYSGRQAAIFAQYDFQQVMRQRQLGDLTARSTGFLAGSLVDQKRLALSRDALGTNLKNTAATFLLGGARAFEREFNPIATKLNDTFFGPGTNTEDAAGRWGGLAGYSILGSIVRSLAPTGLQPLVTSYFARKGAEALGQPTPSVPTQSPLAGWIAQYKDTPLTNDLRPPRDVDNPTRPWPGAWGQ